MEIFLSFGWMLIAFITFGGLTIAVQKRQVNRICMTVPLVFFVVSFFFMLPAPTLLTALGLKPLIGKLHFRQVAVVFSEAFIYTFVLAVLACLVMIIVDCYKAIRKKIAERQLAQVLKPYRPWYLVSGSHKPAPED